MVALPHELYPVPDARARQRIVGAIPPALAIERGEAFLFISEDQRLLNHAIHKYPAKFFPELPRWIIQRYSRCGDRILDPFMGSGTTNLEALLLQRHSVGIDVDPFSRLIARVKTRRLAERSLQAALAELLSAIAEYTHQKQELPDFPYRDNWFQPYILQELAYLRCSIDRLSVSPGVRDFFRICFSSIIRSVSNADNNCTRTVVRKKLNKIVREGDALRRFAKKVQEQVPKMVEFSKIAPKGYRVEIPNTQDARKIRYGEQTFDLAVTSPPYMNAVDYPRTHQLEMYWLGLANGATLADMKRKHVGTEVVYRKDYQDLNRIGHRAIDSVLEQLYFVDERRSFIAYKYLRDMEENMRAVYRVLKRGGHYVIVIGNNRIRGIEFENWRYFIPLAERVGFSLDLYFRSDIINHFIKVPREERIGTDWILVLTK